jgi:carbonic anhydrase
MNKIIISASVALILAGTSVVNAEEARVDAAQSPQHEQPAHNKANAHWSYKGETGPEKWGELSEEFVTCSIGKNQSPIDINEGLLDIEVPPVTFNYSMLIPEKIHNNGHTVQVDMRSGGSIKVDGDEFTLKQFHFHTPSENTVLGKNFPLEAHFVHANKEGELAVVAMMFIPGAPDRTLDALWSKMPYNAGDSSKLSGGVLKNIEMDKSTTNYYRFNGSLTTPPCTEGVRWLVMKTPMSVSKEQVEMLQKALKQPNNRPTQPINARLILE